MNRKSKYFAIIFGILELLFYFFYKSNEIVCEPCDLPPCPPCINPDQITILWIMFFISIVYILFLLWVMLRRNIKDKGSVTMPS